jgi:hypothetical protein
VKEKTAMHFGVYVHDAHSGKWTRVGYAAGNVNLVNVFTFAPVEADQVKYFWAGRDSADATDGLVRAAEIEVYSSEDASLLLDGGGKDDGGVELEL